MSAKRPGAAPPRVESRKNVKVSFVLRSALVVSLPPGTVHGKTGRPLALSSDW